MARSNEKKKKSYLTSHLGSIVTFFFPLHNIDHFTLGGILANLPALQPFGFEVQSPVRDNSDRDWVCMAVCMTERWRPAGHRVTSGLT